MPRKAGARKVPEREKAGVGDSSQACTGQEWPEGHTGQRKVGCCRVLLRLRP